MGCNVSRLWVCHCRSDSALTFFPPSAACQSGGRHRALTETGQELQGKPLLGFNIKVLLWCQLVFGGWVACVERTKENLAEAEYVWTQSRLFWCQKSFRETSGSLGGGYVIMQTNALLSHWEFKTHGNTLNAAAHCFSSVHRFSVTTNPTSWVGLRACC